MNKKISIITPTLSCGGIQRVVSELANYAFKQGYCVSVICLFKSEIHYDILDGVHIVQPSFDYKRGFLNKSQTFLYLLKNIISFQSDTVIGFSEVFNPLTIIATKLAMKNVYISDRSSPDKKFSKFVNLARRLTYPLANGIIAQTGKAKIKLSKSNLNNNILVLPNPVRKINDVYIKKNGNVIISVGKLIPSKNFTDLLSIFASLKNADNWKLFILGDGPDRESLEKQVVSLNLSNRVHFKGEVKDIDKYFSEASIFAFTSISEGFPNALNEAMAYPLASISYDCSAGPSEMIINNENGILIPLGDKQAYINNLQELIDRPEKVRGLAERAMLNRDIFSAHIVCRHYLDFIFQK